MDFYDLLGVDPDATQEAVERAFRRGVREYHPDRNDDPRAPAQFIALKKAYDTLGDPKEREAYDRLGHQAYVDERISGLPSVETWATAADDGTGGADTDPHLDAGDAVGHDTDSTDAGWTAAEPEVDPDFEFDFDVEFDPDEPEADSRTGTGSGAGTTVDPDAGSSVDGFVIDDGASSGLAGGQGAVGGAVQSTEVSKSPTASGAGTARGPKTAPETDTEPEETAPEPSIPEEYVDADATDADPDTGSLSARLRRGLRRVVGWPLVGLADAAYLLALLAYYAANATAVEEAVAAGVSLETLRGLSLTSPATLLRTGPAAVATALGVGLVVLPLTYLLLVRWTRRNSRSWQPSYLYVVGAATPAGWTALSSFVDAPVAADLLAYVVTPLVTIAAMLFFGQLWPRTLRLVRRYRYRLFG